MSVAHGLPDGPPLLDYPCAWAYQVIGRDEAALRAAVAAVIGAERCTVTAARPSRGGRYVSLRVECEVRSEQERNAFFMGLKTHTATVLVL